jgi:chromosome segregation ATPase
LRDKAIQELQITLESKETDMAGLRTKVDESEKKLLSMQGEYTELDQKYQKLLKPARSTKGKQVVEVVYSKSGYSIRKPGDASSRSVTRAALESELGALKAQHSTDLYVKVIIPNNSGLSYNDAWRFTSDMLSKYDYYAAP